MNVTPSIVALALLAACDKPAEPSNPPDATAETEAADADPADGEAEGEKGEATAEAEAEKQPPKDYFTVATFNLAWGHDNLGEAPKEANEQRAQKDEDWEWKLAGIAGLIVETNPDIVALHEVGGSYEVSALIAEIEAAGGPKYEWGFVESDDPRTGHNSAILSRFKLTDERRFDIHLRRHVVSDIELPTGDVVTVVAVHTPEGNRKNAVKARRNQIEALQREVNDIRAEHPVIVMGTFSSNIVPADESYDESAAGVLAGANTGRDEDDCDDSADVGLVLETTTNGQLADRIFTCGLKMRDAETRAGAKIIHEDVDAWDKPWSAVPVDKPPHRDLSDHLFLVAEIELPKPPPPKDEKPGEGDPAEDEAGG